MAPMPPPRAGNRANSCRMSTMAALGIQGYVKSVGKILFAPLERVWHWPIFVASTSAVSHSGSFCRGEWNPKRLSYFTLFNHHKRRRLLRFDAKIHSYECIPRHNNAWFRNSPQVWFSLTLNCNFLVSQYSTALCGSSEIVCCSNGMILSSLLLAYDWSSSSCRFCLCEICERYGVTNGVRFRINRTRCVTQVLKFYITEFGVK